MENNTEIAIIDDHSLFLRGLYGIIKRIMFDQQIECFESIKAFNASSPNLDSLKMIISDIELPGEDVFAFLKKIRSDLPALPVLILTMHKKLSVIKKCKELDINGYLLKDDDDLLLEAIFKVMDGEYYYSPRVDKLFRRYAEEINYLSPREEEILKLVGRGRSNKEIAEELFVTIETIKSHKKNIKLKLGIRETSDLIQYALDHYVL